MHIQSWDLPSIMVADAPRLPCANCCEKTTLLQSRVCTARKLWGWASQAPAPGHVSLAMNSVHACIWGLESNSGAEPVTVLVGVCMECVCTCVQERGLCVYVCV